jgi:type VI secretion system protein ImpL
MLKLILATVVVALSWIAVLLLRLPEIISVAITVIVIISLLTVYSVARYRARRAARQLERELSAQSDAHASRVRPELEGDIRKLQGEFERAIGALKASKVGGGGTSALYALPWYVIVGPPGAGKSTALRNSGLQFPYLSKSGGAVRGIGGTRNCDWWLTNEAIVLDTAGRYTSEGEDRDEWFAFLNLLKRNRSRKPIDGIIVAVGVTSIADQSEDGAVAEAQRIRERIDELVERLQVVVPIYLLFTKCDLIEGFVETFEDLKKQERGQIWGFTLPTGTVEVGAGALFSEHFGELYEGLKPRALRRVGEERALEARERIYAFPEQFALLHDRLKDFVGTLFEQNIYKETPILRGVYFTSGTQEGSPIDRVMAKMVGAFGAAGRTPHRAVLEQKSYFLRDAFATVIFPDRHLGVRARDEQKRHMRRAYGIGGGVLAASLLISLLPTYAFVRNRELVSSTEKIVAGIANWRAGGRHDTSLSLSEFDALSRRLDELHGYDVSRPPMSMRFGMYAGGALYGKLKDLYADVLRLNVLKPLMQREQDAMREFATRVQDGKTEGAEFRRAYDTLKMYLLLTTRSVGEPELSPESQAWLGEQIADVLKQDGGERTDGQRQQMTRHVRRFTQLLSADESLALSRDKELVHDVRVALATRPPADLLLDPLVAEMSGEGKDVSLSMILGASRVIQSRAVHGAFTRRAWETRVRPELSMPGFGAAWVLGPESARTGDGSDLPRLVRARYFERYINEWKEFLRSLRILQTSSSDDALEVLQYMTGGVPRPLDLVFREVAYNVQLPDERPTALSGASTFIAVLPGLSARSKTVPQAPAPDLVIGEVEAAFSDLIGFGVPPVPNQDGSPAAQQPQPVALDIYETKLALVRDALTSALKNPDLTQQLMTELQAALARVQSLIDSQPIRWWPQFETLLKQPIENAARATEASQASGKGIEWCNKVVVPFTRSLQSKYPFQQDGPDAPLADLADFYRPDGILWKFYQAALAADVPEDGDRRFKFSKRLGQSPSFSPQLLTFLSRSREITDVLFPPGAKDPLVEFDVRIEPAPGVASIVFEIGDQVVRTQNEPDRWYSLKWPAEGRSQGAALRVRGPNNLSETIPREGEWGLFRLLEVGQLSVITTRDFTVTWPLNSHPARITLHIRPKRTASPFLGLSRRSGSGLFQSFRGSDVTPPHAIARGGGCETRGL